MNPILSELEARQLDENTITSGHCSGAELMQNAGQKTAYFFIENIPDPFRQEVLVISGKGNNGGDGIVCHHYLLQAGIHSRLVLMSQNELGRDLIQKYDIPINSIEIYSQTELLPDVDWIVDAIFGIGLQRPVEGRYAELINFINTQSNVLSIDMPSGIYTDSGQAAGIAVKAEYTITMGFTKLGHHLNNGIEHSGDVHAVEIGFLPISDDLISTLEVTRSDIKKRIPPLPRNSYKYSRGRIAVLAGSKGMTGAAILVCNGAYRSGGGIVHALVPDSVNSIIESNLIETLTIPIGDNELGYLSETAFDEVFKFVKTQDVFICGPGCNTSPDSIKLLSQILMNYDGPLVLDASGFATIWDKHITLKDLSCRGILTPHIMEFSRLFNISVNEIRNNPVGVCRKIKPELNGNTLILKGSPTIIVNEDKPLGIMNHGTPLLATAGSGDVLTGILGGLMAQGMTPWDAALAGTWIHADSASRFRETVGPRGMKAGDLLNFIPKVFEDLCS